MSVLRSGQVDGRTNQENEARRKCQSSGLFPAIERIHQVPVHTGRLQLPFCRAIPRQSLSRICFVLPARTDISLSSQPNVKVGLGVHQRPGRRPLRHLQHLRFASLVRLHPVGPVPPRVLRPMWLQDQRPTRQIRRKSPTNPILPSWARQTTLGQLIFLRVKAAGAFYAPVLRPSLC
jgi:hypothetical protein